MLDQNTDRMWYVIGAVLVGAAIILIANGALPQMFASVTDSFTNVANEANGEILKIYNNVDQSNNILDRVTIIDDHWIHQMSEYDGPVAPIPYQARQGVSGFVTELIPVEPGSTFRTYQPINLDTYTAAFIAEYDNEGYIIDRPWNRNEAEELDFTLSNQTYFVRYGAKSSTGKYEVGSYRLELLE